MKKMKLSVIVLFVFIGFTACNKDDDAPEPTPEPTPTTLVGQDGNPRFNLVFTNPENVDLDLYVKAPNGTVVYYGNASAAGGTLDVDCLCDGCPQGPNENIYWENGQAPTGQYEYWVDYFGNCGTSGASSSFTLRVIKNGQVLTTKTGTLTSGESQRFIHTQQ